MVRVFLALSASVAILSHAAVTLATKVTFTNHCGYAINLYDNAKTDTIAHGSSTTRELTNGFSGMFRHGTDTQANCTLLLLSLADSSVFDCLFMSTHSCSLSLCSLRSGRVCCHWQQRVVRHQRDSTRGTYVLNNLEACVHVKSSQSHVMLSLALYLQPGNCKSFADCKAVTGKSGFNVPMSITPTIASGVTVPSECKAITCGAEGCNDAYLYPSDDLKTHNCPSTGVEFTVAFCPGGASSQSTTTTTTTTQAPVSTMTTPAATPAAQTPASTKKTTTTANQKAKGKTTATLAEVGNDYQSGVVTAGSDAPSAVTSTTAVQSAGNSTSLAGATIKSSFSYRGVLAGNVAGTYDMVTAASSCTKKTVSLNSPVGPLSEEVSMVFRGPMEIYNIAVFTASSSASDWARVSAFSDSGESDNILFLNNLNVDYSGGKKSPQGFASADGAKKAATASTFAGKLAEASNPSNTYGGPGIATGAEVNIMLPKKCSDDGTCKGYYDDNGYHGWDGGKKMFVTKVKMPTGSAPNQPAIWMLNAQVLRSNQYGCNCRGSGAVGGCGELDIAEVIETNAARDRVTTHYYFYDGSHPAGGDNFAARPTNAATTYVTIIDDSGEGTVKVLEIGGDDFDFSARSISASTIQAWLSASDKNLL